MSHVHKGALAEMMNRMIGRTGLDTDLHRAWKELGMDRTAGQALKTLQRGQFFVYGPAFPTTEVRMVRTGLVATTHASGVATALYSPPPAPQAASRTAIARESGASADSSAYRNNLSALRSLGLIDYPDAGRAVATTLLFPNGLPRS